MKALTFRLWRDGLVSDILRQLHTQYGAGCIRYANIIGRTLHVRVDLGVSTAPRFSTPI